MPKFTVLGTTEKPMNPMVLTHLLDTDGDVSTREPDATGVFDNYELICRKYTGDGRDVIFGYDRNRDNGCLYLGHWNDGCI